MRCRVGLQTIDYTASFDQPLFSLAQRQADLLQACFRKLRHDFPVELSGLQATGGATFADCVVAVHYPPLRAGVEVRVDRLSGRSSGLASGEEADQLIVFVSRCQEAVGEVFPDLVVASTSINVMSWLTCDDDDDETVETLLAARQQVQFDPAAVGAEKAQFIVRGQLTNEEEGWSLGFGLEPSAPSEFDLYLVCLASYSAARRYRTIHEQEAHIAAASAAILDQFGFQVVR